MEITIVAENATSILVARIMCLIYFSFAIGIMSSEDYYKSAIEDLLNSKGFLLLGGWLAIAAGAALVSYHNLWVNDWRVIITIIGWIALIKGVWLLAFPQSLGSYTALYQKSGLKKLGPLVLLLGLIFGYFGFFT
ncbi:MAG: hypothetical protein Tsb0034_02050 [Ekhidna sp.]